MEKARLLGQPASPHSSSSGAALSPEVATRQPPSWALPPPPYATPPRSEYHTSLPATARLARNWPHAKARDGNGAAWTVGRGWTQSPGLLPGGEETEATFLRNIG